MCKGSWISEQSKRGGFMRATEKQKRIGYSLRNKPTNKLKNFPGTDRTNFLILFFYIY